MKLSVLIPYRPDSVHRERIHRTTKPMWEKTGLEVIYQNDGAEPGQPFSFAKAVNRARTKATGDWFLVYSVDALPPSKGILALLDCALKKYPWIAPMRGQARFSHDQTMQIMAGTPSRQTGDPAGGFCLGHQAIVAVKKKTWDTLGGFDERFVGWGPEDKAFHLALKTFFPDGLDLPTDEVFRTLWHPPTPRVTFAANQHLFSQYQELASDPVKFRAWYSSEVTRHNSGKAT
jgi:hypothetical protein